jgi:acyl-coenzyme A synthetase/AMP-(fatty) acid ligase
VAPGGRARLVLGRSGSAAAAENGVGTLRTTPSGLAAFLADPAVRACRDRLRRIVLDGEDGWPALVTAAERILPGVRIALLRGPAAAAADLIAEFPGSARTAEPGARPVLLDAHGQLVPIGVPGELHLDLPHPPRPVGAAAPPAPVTDPAGRGGPLHPTGLRARTLVDGRLELLGAVGDALTVNRHRSSRSS